MFARTHHACCQVFLRDSVKQAVCVILCIVVHAVGAAFSSFCLFEADHVHDSQLYVNTVGVLHFKSLCTNTTDERSQQRSRGEDDSAQDITGSFAAQYTAQYS